MKQLRQIHLYLGAFFAPMLLFFAISGIWQTFRLNDDNKILKTLSAIHTLSRHKSAGWQPVSLFLEIFVALMSLGLIFSIITGIIMAFKFGRARLAFCSLFAGIIVPLLIIFVLSR